MAEPFNLHDGTEEAARVLRGQIYLSMIFMFSRNVAAEGKRDPSHARRIQRYLHRNPIYVPPQSAQATPVLAHSCE